MGGHRKTKTAHFRGFTPDFVQNEIRKVLADVISKEVRGYLESGYAVLCIAEFYRFDPVLVVILPNSPEQSLPDLSPLFFRHL